MYGGVRGRRGQPRPLLDPHAIDLCAEFSQCEFSKRF
jgi:hypothetical protein